MVIATMTSTGRLTVPQDVCDALGLVAGSRVEFVPAGEGRWLLHAVPTLEIPDPAGAASADEPTPGVDAIDESIAAGFAGLADGDPPEPESDAATVG